MLLSDLQQLKEVYLECGDSVLELFEQKRRCDRADLKIYSYGLLLNGADDPAVAPGLEYLDEVLFGYMVANPSRLGEAIPLVNSFL